jgi:hypothetical protein
MPWGAATTPAPAVDVPAGEPVVPPAVPAAVEAPPPGAPSRLAPPSRIERLRTAIGPDRFDLIRIVAVVALVGFVIGAVQLIPAEGLAGGNGAASSEVEGTSAAATATTSAPHGHTASRSHLARRTRLSGRASRAFPGRATR